MISKDTLTRLDKSFMTGETRMDTTEIKTLQTYEKQGLVKIIWAGDPVRPHCEGAPAKTYLDGREEWLQDGLYHRLDGPAIVPRSGEEEGSYWCIRGVSVYSFKEYQKITGCSDSALLILKLRWKEIEHWV